MVPLIGPGNGTGPRGRKGHKMLKQLYRLYLINQAAAIYRGLPWYEKDTEPDFTAATNEQLIDFIMEYLRGTQNVDL